MDFDYRLAFWILATAVFVYVVTHTRFYIGYDEDKYNAAHVGVLLNNKR